MLLLPRGVVVDAADFVSGLVCRCGCGRVLMIVVVCMLLLPHVVVAVCCAWGCV